MTIEQLKVMRERVSSLKQFLAIEDKKMKIESDRQLSLSAGFWDDNQRATSTMKLIKVNEYWLKMYQQVETSVEDFAVLFDFWKMGDATEEETKLAFELAVKLIEEAEYKSTLNQPEDLNRELLV